MTLLAPSILAADFAVLGDQITRVSQAGCDWIHLDIMDGHFVPNLSIGPAVVAAIRPFTDLFFDVHLMLDNPMALVDDFIQAGANGITIHYEACDDLGKDLDTLKEKGVAPGISIKPKTPVEVVFPYLKDMHLILVMSVEPGFGGQSFMPEALERIRTLRTAIDAIGSRCKIQVDGGIYLSNVSEVVEAGAHVIVSGSGVFSGNEIETQVAAFKALW